MCLGKKDADLEIERLSTLNWVLVADLLWRFANEIDKMWRRIIRGMFGELDGGWSAQEANGAFGLGLWKAIRR